MDVTPPAPDGSGLDLRPRTREARPARRWGAVVVIVLILGGLAFIATKALSDAALFFYNADEAVAKRDELGDSRFRLQGSVEEGTIADTGDGVEFVVAYNGVEVAVVHRGDPPELFEAGTPVVLEGRWDPSGEVFASDRMLVKHDEEYVEANDDRLKEAEEGGQVPVSSTAPAGTSTDAP